MILQLANLKPSGSKFSGEDPVEVLTWPEDDTDIIRPSGPLRWTFNAKLFEDELLIEGEVAAEFSGICARCGKDMVLEVAEPLCFSVDVSGDVDEVDLTSELRDVILLALPNHPVCSPACEGLVTSDELLGVQGPADHSEPLADSPWDALDNLVSQSIPPTENGE